MSTIDGEEALRETLRHELLDMAGVAQALRVKKGTVHQWTHRKVFLPPLMVLGSVPIWLRRDVMEWAIQTGRIEGSVYDVS